MSPPPDLVTALANHRRGRGHPIPHPIKSAVVDYAVARRAAGDSVRATAIALEMPIATLHAWLGTTHKRGLVPVEVSCTATLAPIQPALRLECPGGYVVHGLDAEQVVAVLRGLS